VSTPVQFRYPCEELILQLDLAVQLCAQSAHECKIVSAGGRRKPVSDESFLHKAGDNDHPWAAPLLVMASKRTLDLWRSCADIEATCRFAEEFGTLSRQHMEEFSPILRGMLSRAQRSSLRVNNEPVSFPAVGDSDSLE
jgi:hypothetical protein